MRRARRLGCALALAMASCTFSNLTPQARFSEATYLVNDAARWGQLDVASHQVAPSYKPRFLARREGWGERIQIAEADVVHMHIDRDRDEAYSVVNVTWTSDNITVRKSVIAQVWKTERGQFRLFDETLKSGDRALFAE